MSFGMWIKVMFPGNSKILMADGTQTPIEEMRIGDQVASLHEGGHGARYPSKVTSIEKAKAQEMWNVVVSDYAHMYTTGTDALLANGHWASPCPEVISIQGL